MKADILKEQKDDAHIRSKKKSSEGKDERKTMPDKSKYFEHNNIMKIFHIIQSFPGKKKKITFWI